MLVRRLRLAERGRHEDRIRDTSPRAAAVHRVVLGRDGAVLTDHTEHRLQAAGFDHKAEII
jgi:hypothetical protein